MIADDAIGPFSKENSQDNAGATNRTSPDVGIYPSCQKGLASHGPRLSRRGDDHQVRRGQPVHPTTQEALLATAQKGIGKKPIRNRKDNPVTPRSETHAAKEDS